MKLKMTNIPLSELRENIVGLCDEIIVATAVRLWEPHRPALERLEADLKEAVEQFKESVK